MPKRKRPFTKHFKKRNDNRTDVSNPESGQAESTGEPSHKKMRNRNRGKRFINSNVIDCVKNHQTNVIRNQNSSLASTQMKKHIEDIEYLTEVDIGVTEYVSDLPGFTGRLKTRFSDFHVNEIDLEGNVAKLTDLSIPPEKIQDPKEEDDQDLVKRYQLDLLPIEQWDKIHELVQGQDEGNVIEVEVSSMSKDERRKIHEAVKSVFGGKIVASTISKDDKKFITFKKFNKKDKVDMREKWPESYGGEYVYFLVHKERMDTIEANIQISQRLMMHPASFCYAGVKDRRAKTTQWFCVRKVKPSKIVQGTRNLKNLYVGNFCFKKHTLKLGQLKGNRFRIAIRNISAETELVNAALESLKDKGFINYYGLQRFGNYKEAPTHKIGLELMKGNWKEACMLILKPREQYLEKDQAVVLAKSIYKDTANAKLAYSKLSWRHDRTIEARLLSGLAKNNQNDFVNALEKIPRNVRLLYIHSYQSLIWNKIASIRIKEYGLKPVLGDLVVTSELQCMETEDDDETNETEHATKIITKNVKVLKEEELNDYTIYDVVLPLPGYDIIYPENIIVMHYKDLLEADGLSLEMPKQKVKTYTYSGAYRKLMERVSNFSWKNVNYESENDDLIRSDYEELRNVPQPQENDGKYKALIVDFCLSSSCYATMALREVMKMDTSVQTHIKFGDNLILEENELQNITDEAEKVEVPTEGEKKTETIKCEPSDVTTEVKIKMEDESQEDTKELKLLEFI